MHCHFNDPEFCETLEACHFFDMEDLCSHDMGRGRSMQQITKINKVYKVVKIYCNLLRLESMEIISGEYCDMIII